MRNGNDLRTGVWLFLLSGLCVLAVLAARYHDARNTRSLTPVLGASQKPRLHSSEQRPPNSVAAIRRPSIRPARLVSWPPAEELSLGERDNAAWPGASHPFESHQPPTALAIEADRSESLYSSSVAPHG